MGYRSSWIASKGQNLDRILSLTGLIDSGATSDEPDLGIFHTTLSIDGEPWDLVVADGSKFYGHLDESYSLELSKLADGSYFFYCNDTCMDTTFHAHQQGAEKWAIAFGEHTDGEVQFSGLIPNFVDQIYRRLKQEQEEPGDIGTMYEITAEVGEHQFTFRHDDLPESEFVLLKAPAKKPFWKFW